MPEVIFTIRLPDGLTERCYSPSTVILQHFRADETLTIETFVTRSRIAFHQASERVRERYGYACTSALSQLAEIERLAGRYPADGPVTITSI